MLHCIQNLLSHDGGKACCTSGEDHITCTQTTCTRLNILRIRVFMSSLHIIFDMIFCYFPIVINPTLHGFDPYTAYNVLPAL